MVAISPGTPFGLLHRTPGTSEEVQPVNAIVIVTSFGPRTSPLAVSAVHLSLTLVAVWSRAALLTAVKGMPGGAASSGSAADAEPALTANAAVAAMRMPSALMGVIMVPRFP